MSWDRDYDHPERTEDAEIADLDAEREWSDPFRDVGEGTRRYSPYRLDGAETDPWKLPAA